MKPRSNMMRPRIGAGFRLWFAFCLAAVLCIYGLVGFGIYTVATNPEGVGRFAGRIIGGAVDEAKR